MRLAILGDGLDSDCSEAILVWYAVGSGQTMCGIAGIVDYAGKYQSTQLRAIVRTMNAALAHRGPDDAGLWLSEDGRVCLGHRRLAIIDLRPAGRQPMSNEDGKVVVTFNGEIYNYLDLADRLRRTGHQLRSRTDTEVLCHWFEEPATAAHFSQLVGMYAFGIWNQHRRELLLARDPFGKKPIYWTQTGATLAFASELSALRALPDWDWQIDEAAIEEYLLLQYIHAPRTIYRNIQKLVPGTFTTFRFDGSHQPTAVSDRHFQFQPNEPYAEPDSQTTADTLTVLPTPADETTALRQLQELLRCAVADRLVGEVPLGAFLSGGIDSAVVVAMLACELGTTPKTFALGFAGAAESEHEAARAVADHLQTDHHETIVEPTAVALLDHIVAALDEPNGDSSCLPVYLLCQFARRSVTVALSGDGGDELFGGYGRYGDTLLESVDSRRHWRSWRHFGRPWRPGWMFLQHRLLTMNESVVRQLRGPLQPATAALLQQMESAIQRDTIPLLHRLRRNDVRSYLPGAVLAKVDRMSMRFALEVRSPLLDVRLARWASRLPTDWCWPTPAHVADHNPLRHSKTLLKKLLCRYLPESMVYRPKQGFGLPAQCWSQTPLLNLAQDRLLSSSGRLQAFLPVDRLRRYLHRQQDPNHFAVYQIWELLVLETWLRQQPSASLPLLADDYQAVA